MKKIHYNIRKSILLSTLLIVSSITISCKKNIELKPDVTTFKQQGKGYSSNVSMNTVDKPYIILISADGFRFDYANMYNATNLLAYSATGIRAKSMLPSYPSVTHSNHYSLITGLYPGHTGIVGNEFYDKATLQPYNSSNPSWFSRESIWHTASKQGVVTADVNWPQGRAITANLPTNLFYEHDEVADGSKLSDMNKSIKKWFTLPASQRPHLITIYFSETDEAGHLHGPESPEVEAAVKSVDDKVRRVVEIVQSAGVNANFIFLSDHGMIKNSQEKLGINKLINMDKFVVGHQNSIINLYAKNSTVNIIAEANLLKAKETDRFKVYLNQDFPSKYHYAGIDDQFKRTGDIILVPNKPFTFKSNPAIGMHGFDPDTAKAMHATFMAWGPAFKNNTSYPTFKNVEIYNLLTKILGLTSTNNDGTGELAEAIVK